MNVLILVYIGVCVSYNFVSSKFGLTVGRLLYDIFAGILFLMIIHLRIIYNLDNNNGKNTKSSVKLTSFLCGIIVIPGSIDILLVLLDDSGVVSVPEWTLEVWLYIGSYCFILNVLSGCHVLDNIKECVSVGNCIRYDLCCFNKPVERSSTLDVPLV